MLDVLILAAGRGERLRPLTDSTPKPLLPLGSKTLIEHQLERLGESGFSNVVINLAWLGGKIRDHLGNGRQFGLQIHYSAEPEGALETGGGIVNALALLQSDPFIVINGDILTDFDYAGLGIADDFDMHLVLVPNPPHHPTGDFAVHNGKLENLGTGDTQSWTYSGIGCFRRRIFQSLKPGRFPLLPVIQGVITASLVSAEVYPGPWIDVGSPERLEQARKLNPD